MNSQSLDTLLLDAFKNPADALQTVKPRMQTLAKKNDEAIAEISKPDILRTPTADELTEMRQYAIDMKNKFPMWSKRKIRKEVQQKFNIKIYK